MRMRNSPRRLLRPARQERLIGPTISGRLASRPACVSWMCSAVQTLLPSSRPNWSARPGSNRNRFSVGSRGDNKQGCGRRWACAGDVPRMRPGGDGVRTAVRCDRRPLHDVVPGTARPITRSGPGRMPECQGWRKQLLQALWAEGTINLVVSLEAGRAFGTLIDNRAVAKPTGNTFLILLCLGL
jgi:hypothetical protein